MNATTHTQFGAAHTASNALHTVRAFVAAWFEASALAVFYRALVD